jgi:predicted alpha/beta hydrolase family esterase
MHFQSTIILIPGLGNSGQQHWQSLWEKRFDFARVEQKDWQTPVCSDWIEAINKEVKKYDPAKVILVAHSLACITVAYWAQKFNIPVKSTLLVAPSDTEAGTYPTGTTGFKPVPLIKLPFKSVLVTSSDDYYVKTERAQLFAGSWGSEFINIGNAGHINVASGFGEWDHGLELLKQLDE